MEIPLVADNSAESLGVISFILNNLPYGEVDDTSEVPDRKKSDTSEIINLLLDKIAYNERLENLSDRFDASSALISTRGSYIGTRIPLDCWCNGYPNDPILKSWQEVWEARHHLSILVKKQTGKSFCNMLLNFPTENDEQNNSTIKNLLDFAKCLNSMEKLLKKQRALLEFMNVLVDCYLKKTEKKNKRRLRKMVESEEVPSFIHLDLMGDHNSVKEPRTWIDSIYVKKNFRGCPQKVVQYFPGIDELNLNGRGMSLRTKPKNYLP